MKPEVGIEQRIITGFAIAFIGTACFALFYFLLVGLVLKSGPDYFEPALFLAGNVFFWIGWRFAETINEWVNRIDY